MTKLQNNVLLQILLYGDEKFPDELNKTILLLTLQFIHKSGCSWKCYQGIPRTRKSPMDYLVNRNENSFFMTPAIPVEILDIIGLLKTGKSIGPNSIAIKSLKALSPHISSQLSDIINESFQTSIFP